MAYDLSLNHCTQSRLCVKKGSKGKEKALSLYSRRKPHFLQLAKAKPEYGSNWHGLKFLRHLMV